MHATAPFDPTDVAAQWPNDSSGDAAARVRNRFSRASYPDLVDRRHSPWTETRRMLFARKSTCQPGARALKRRAAAVVELAVCLPMIALIVLATIECANMLFLRQTLVQASYEAVKVAVHRKGTNDTAIAAALRVTDGRQIKRVTVDFDPSDVQKVERGEVIRATVSARSSENSFFDVPPFQNQVLIGTAVMVKE